MNLKVKRFVFIILMLLNLKFAISQHDRLVYPKNGWYSNDGLLDFKWNRLNSSETYVLQIADEPSFSNLVFESGTLLSPECLDVQLSLGNYFWRIRVDSGISVAYTSYFTLNVFKPSQLAELSFHIDPALGYTLDGSNNIQALIDQSPNQFSLQQSSPSKRPSIEQIVLNGYPAIKFTGAQDLIGGDILDIMLNSRTMFVVGKNTTANGAFFAKSLAGSAANRYALLKENGKFLYLMFDNLNIGNPLNSALGYTNFGLHIATIDRLKSKFFYEINNLPIGNNPFTSTGNINSSFRFIFGAYNNPSDNGEVLFFNGYINEVVFIETSDSITKSKVSNYLRYKYSPPVDLGRDTTVISNICPITLSIPASFTNITWNTGATGTSISTNKSGTYWVQATDIFGYVSSDTVLVNFPEAAPPPNQFLCVDSTKMWDPKLPTNYTYNWSNGSIDTVLVTSQIGTYQLTFTDTLGCSKISEAFTFTLDSYPSTFSIGPDTTVCAGNVLYARTNVAETVAYSWQDGSTGEQLPVFSTGAYWVTVENVNGCIARDTVAIVVSGVAPLANFQVSDVCLGESLSFEDLSVAGASTDTLVTWAWNFGDGYTDTVANPSYVPTISGERNVTLTILSSGNCGAFITKSVTVHQPPLAQFTATGFCSAQSVQMNDATQAGSSPVTNWLWNFGQPSSGLANASTLASPSKMYNQAGNFTILLTVKDANNCYHDTSLVHTVYWSPTASFSIPDACVDAGLEITNTSQVTNPSAIQSTLWSFGDNTYATSVVPTKSFPNYGVHTIQLDVMTGEGCTDQEIKQLYIHPNPMAFFSIGPACMGTYTDLADQSVISEGTIDSTMWVINQEDTLYGATSRVVFDDLQQQQVEVHVFSQFGCEAVSTQFIEPEVELNAAFTMDAPYVAATEPITFTDASVGATQILWDLGDGTVATAGQPTHEYGTAFIDSLVPITLYVSSATGCLDTVTNYLSVRPAVLDAKFKQLFLEEDNGYYIVGTSFENTGTVTINEATLSVSWAPGPLFQEAWNGELKPGASTIYVFNGKPSSFQYPYAEANYICLDGITQDDTGNQEILLEDNRLCTLLSGEAPLIFPIYPNPATEEVHIGILLTESGTTSLDVLDARGRLLSTLLDASSLTAGTHSYDLSVSNYREGMYYLRLTVNGEVYVKQFVKR